MLTVRMNNVAVDSLGALVVPSPTNGQCQLSPELDELVADGILRSGEAIVFAKDIAEAATVAQDIDLTQWECQVNSLHLDDVMSVEVDTLDDGEPVISENEQRRMLSCGVVFSFSIAQLVHGLDDPVQVRCILSANSSSGTFRFHRVRPGQSWLASDLDSYQHEKLIVIDSNSHTDKL